MHADAFYRHPGDREGGLAGPFALAVALHLLVALLFWVAWWWSPQRRVEPAASSPVIEASLVMSASDIAAAQRRAEDAPKPDPEPFLTACRLLNARPEATWVIEDSPTGARAGLAAGCYA